MEELNPQPNTTPLPPIPPMPPEPKKSHAVLWTLIGVFVLAVLAGGVFLWQENKKAQELAQVPNNAEVKADPTADWKTYKNEEYRFEFEYPQTSLVSVKQSTSDFIELSVAGSGAILVKADKSYKEPEHALDDRELIYMNTTPYGHEKIGENTWRAYFLPEGLCSESEAHSLIHCSTPPIHALAALHNGIYYSIQLGEKKGVTDAQKEIIATFKFTK